MTKATTGALEAAIQMIDGHAQDVLSEIAAIAKLILTSLEDPLYFNDTETIAHAIAAIRSKALDAENCINAYAEEVGCHYVDEAQRRRLAAKCGSQSRRA